MKDAKQIFEQSVNDTDVASANRLRLMRRDALMNTAAKRSVFLRWAPAGALAAGLFAAAVIWLPQQAEQPINDVVVSPENLLLEDETEMLDWLADAPVAIDESAGVMQ